MAATARTATSPCTLPTGDDRAAAPSPVAAAESDLQLSLDENGQLVVDLVLADGTLEPVWIYERAGRSEPGRTLSRAGAPDVTRVSDRSAADRRAASRFR